MDGQIKKVMDAEFDHLPIDKRLLDRILKYEKDFINKNEDHITFFGGHLMGVQIVRFDPRDRAYWFDEVLEINEQALQEPLYALRDPHRPKEPLIDPDFNVRSDIMNITCAYLVHRFLTANNLPHDKQREGAEAVVRIMLYKFLTSLLWNYFKYPANPAVAEATYNALSLKFGLKKNGNWKKYLDERAHVTVEPGAIHYKNLVSMKDDEDFLYFIGDTQGRIRGTVKSIYAIFDRMNKAGIKIVSASSVMEYDGEMILKDKSRTYQTEIRYIADVIGDRGSFIKPELLKIIEKSVPTANPDMLLKTLQWMSDNAGYGKDDIVNQLTTKTVIYSFNYLAQNPSLIKGKRDISGVLFRLRGSFMASRSSDEDLMQLREMAELIAGYATGSKNDTVKKSIRTAVLLYIIGRIMAKDYYS
ncbi:hypothetical protein [Ralstonia phage RSF1]|uniref:Uncharacterized protein n=1 Tax=Ralstonia phage RSF1 TaxID=1689679 RepID=A0A0K2QQF4_9CAUD|nr:hypothetical protein AVU11_gp022 [Ralstonia phage RSF1]BAS04814.1 hypothetical protein [Ralstonia phage RSF1]